MIEEEQKSSRKEEENFFTEAGELKDEENKLEGSYDLYDTDLGELTPELVNERYLEFKCSKPTKVGSLMMYEVCGYDREGDFKEMKRYSDFDKLRKVLISRWPGFFIPAIPPKQSFVSTY